MDIGRYRNLGDTRKDLTPTAQEAYDAWLFCRAHEVTSLRTILGTILHTPRATHAANLFPTLHRQVRELHHGLLAQLDERARAEYHTLVPRDVDDIDPTSAIEMFSHVVAIDAFIDAVGSVEAHRFQRARIREDLAHYGTSDDEDGNEGDHQGDHQGASANGALTRGAPKSASTPTGAYL